MSDSAPTLTPPTLTPPTATPPSSLLPTAEEAVTHTLLNCLLREISGPEHQTAVTDGNLLIRLPRRDALLRVALRRTSLLGAHRFTGPVEHTTDDSTNDSTGGQWQPVGWEQLAVLVGDELGLRTGLENDEFLEQMRSTHAGVSSALAMPRPEHEDAFQDSEQSLLFGHRFHPTPKARSGAPADWAAYAPETGAAFPLRHLAIRTPLVLEEYVDPDDLATLDRHRPADLPDGYTFLPAHPWQWQLVRDRPSIRRALTRGDLVDLGEGPETVWPTSSVRTVHDGEGFLKFSLNVRITNCLRKNASYELTGAVALTRHLTPVAADLAARFPGTTLLREPAYRTISLGNDDSDDDSDGVGDGVESLEALAVIVREGLPRTITAAIPGSRVLLAAAVADEYPTSQAQVSRLLPSTDDPQLMAAQVMAWWSAYLRLLVPPVVAAYSDHGVVFEPHLQNVLVAVDADAMPIQILLRDLEGTKLVPDHPANAEFLATLPESVARPMTYDAQRGWDRVTYCLVVNHLSEMLAALADLAPHHAPNLEARLWREVRTVLLECAERHPDDARLRALLAGVPLPAKANLLTRWERLADREAGYVRLPSPLSEEFLSRLDRADDRADSEGAR